MISDSLMLQTLLLTPFGAALVTLLLKLSIKNALIREQLTRFVAIAAPLLTALTVLILFVTTDGSTVLRSKLFDWVHVGEFNITLSLMLDPLALWMTLFISLISLLIFIYATGYMKEDKGYPRFFIYFHLFLGSMLLLVLADTPVIMFLGWEGVGLCSYLLIGFYFNDKKNLGAANKAFYLNRIGDLGFVAALSLLFVTLGSTGMDYASLEKHIGDVDTGLLTLIAVLFFVGAMGKSAQIPLYVWLPDAMAGPTPVSALIHAATMVTAGVYMIVRFGFLYERVPDVGLFIAYIGAFSALLAALFATYASDIKKILAYSTMSQLGYMFVAAGLGAYSQAMFHLFTHAFFKALLFMGAGAVIVALHHEQNIFKMGGLRNFMPAVFISMFFATVAITGIPPFSGFFSKDAITAYAFFSHNYIIWSIITVTALLTSFYMFRLFFTVFTAMPQNDRRSVDMVPLSMQWPLILLALASVINGLWNLPHYMGGEAMASTFLSLPDLALHADTKTEWFLTLINTLLAFSGMYLAYVMFGKSAKEPNLRNPVSRLFIHKLYVDEIYHKSVVVPIKALSRLSISYLEPMFFAVIAYSVKSYRYLALKVNTLQSGDIRSYLIYMLLGILMITVYLLILFEALA